MTSYASIHILVPQPSAEFRDGAYPSIQFGDRGKVHALLSVTGDLVHRAAFAADLRAVADAIETWGIAEAPDPIDEAKARYDRMTSGPTNMDIEPDGNEPDGPGDAYWQSGGPIHESATYRRDMADAGLAAKVRA